MSVAFPIDFDQKHRRCLVGGEPMLFHCHHFSTYLQQTLLDADYIDTRPILVGAGNEVAHQQLQRIFAQMGVSDPERRKAIAAECYRWAGFGLLDLGSLDVNGGVLETASSHYSQAWKTKFEQQSRFAVDFFTTGWLTGALSAIYDQPQGTYEGVQTACLAKGDRVNRFELTKNGANYHLYTSPGGGELFKQDLLNTKSPVDEEGVYEALKALPLEGDSASGLISAFGVLLTRHYANYYNRISFTFEHELQAMFGEEGLAIAEPLLVESGHVCAFNTFGGIMKSIEWQGLIQPQLNSREDWVYGMVAAVNALGWGRWQVASVTPKEARFVIHNDYESIGYRALYGQAEHHVSYLAKGAAMGIMDLVYVGDIQSHPDLNPAFYDRLFKTEESYHGDVVRCLAKGDDYTEILVHRS